MNEQSIKDEILKNGNTKDNIHLDYDNHLLRDYIENEIYIVIKTNTS